MFDTKLGGLDMCKETIKALEGTKRILPKTRKLYDDDVYLKETHAQILYAKQEADHIDIVLDQTIFFPTGGGQSCDKGIIMPFENGLEYPLSFPISSIFEDDGVIFHKVRAGESANAIKIMSILQPSASVLLKIDWSHRFDNMQRHLGEHILTGAFHRLYCGENRGFHMGSDYITIDIALPNGGLLTREMIDAAELDANNVIYKNEQVLKVFFQDMKAAKEALPLRKSIDTSDAVSVVTVGDSANPSDCCPCCGTHPKQSGEVGIIKIYGFEKNKGMTRIYFDAGKRAFLHIQKSENLLKDVSQHFSASSDDLITKLHARHDREKALRDTLYKAEKLVYESYRKELIKLLSPSKSHVVHAELQVLSDDDIGKLGRSLSEYIGDAILLLTSTERNSIFFFSNGNPHAGKLAKEILSSLGGKGGGKADFARGVLARKEDAVQVLARVTNLTSGFWLT